MHFVLAKLPDAPAGSRGISMFLVPKFLPDAAGKPGAANGVTCASVEHKLGIHGSATCVMNFDDARGWLIGEVNGGLKNMFTMMNHARLWVGLQGLAQCERGLQASLAYARERRQGRTSGGGPGPADPIIGHPDVRRMLLTQKSLIEGARVLILFAGMQMDRTLHHPDAAARAEAEELLSLLTPVVKGFVTGMSLECTSDALQVHGGHGYVRETGVEQFFRDARITMIYEGANGVQAMDLLGRKVLGSGGALARRLGGLIGGFCERHVGRRRARRVRLAPGRPAEGMERGDRGGRPARGAQSRRDRRSLDGLPAAHRLPLPRLVLGLDGIGLGRGAQGRQPGCRVPPRQARDRPVLLPAHPAARRGAPRRDGRGRPLADGNSRRPVLGLSRSARLRGEAAAQRPDVRVAAGAQEFGGGPAAHAVRAHQQAGPRRIDPQPAVQQAAERHGLVAADGHRLEFAFHRLADVDDAIAGRDRGRERQRDVDVDGRRRRVRCGRSAPAQAGIARRGQAAHALREQVDQEQLVLSSWPGRSSRSFSTSMACIWPSTAGTGPSTPASAQLPTSPSRVGSGHWQRRHEPPRSARTTCSWPSYW